VQHTIVGNNQLATKFTFCHLFLSLLQKSSELLLQCCRWESWRQARDECWISCGHPASKQED